MKRFSKVFMSFVTAVMLTVSLVPIALAESHPEATQDVVEIALGNDDFSILVSALQKAGLVETLQGEGPFTVFAPTNAAFATLLEALDVTAEELLAQPDLAKVLTYHVVAGKVMAGDLTDGLEAATVNGEKLVFDLSGDAMVNDSKLIDTDIEATNGVIHVVNEVLVPENFKLQEVDLTEEDVPKTGVSSNVGLFVALLLVGGAFVIVLSNRRSLNK